MKLTVFGATGKTGQHLVEQALADGHEITVLARTPSKLTLQHARLRVITGNVLDAQKVDEAVAGSEAVISLLGPGKNQGEHIVTRGTSHIIAAMKKQGIRRIVLAAGAGVGDSNDRPTFVDRVISLLLHLMG
jgi:putative NADH-flavin reductase